MVPVWHSELLRGTIRDIHVSLRTSTRSKRVKACWTYTPVHCPERLYILEYTSDRVTTSTVTQFLSSFNQVPSASRKRQKWHRNKGCASPTKKRRKTSHFVETYRNRRNHKRKDLQLDLAF